MAAFGLVEKDYASIRGVAMEPSVLGPARTFTLLRDAQLTRRARWAARGGAVAQGEDICCDGVAFWPPGHLWLIPQQPGREGAPRDPVLHVGKPRWESSWSHGPDSAVPWAWALGSGCAPSRPHPLCSHSNISPVPLPLEYTVVFLLRLLPETPREAFALWQMTAEDFQPVLGVLLDGQSRVGRQQAQRPLSLGGCGS